MADRNDGKEISMNDSKSMIPQSINQAGPQELEIKWADGHRSLYPARELRLGCRCANCVDEWNGSPRLAKDQIPLDVHPRTVENVGRYGLKIFWSDGHSTGIYSYDYLRSLCGCDACRAKS